MRHSLARTRARVALCWLAVAISGCGDDAAPPVTTDDRFLTELTSADDYARLAGEGAELKYLLVADADAVQPPLDGPCIFQDTARFAFHVQFLRQYPAYESLQFDTYTNLVLRRSGRVFWGGTLKLWANTVHPVSQQRGVISYQVYTADSASENPSLDELSTIHTQLTQCMGYARDLLVFVPDGAAQTAWARAERDALMNAGVPVLMPEQLRPGLGAEVYSEGEAYGYLRVVPQGQALDDYSPRDVVIVQSAPNDIGVVSGLISQFPQNLHSHVNLRLREKQTPNASVPDIYANALVRSLDGHLVRVVATNNDVRITPATLASAQAHWDAHRPVLPDLRADLTVTTLQTMAALTHGDAIAYGTKAANLGELHGILDTVHRVEGFGIPFSAYVAFVHDNQLDALVDDLLSDPLIRQDRAHLDSRLKTLRDAIKAGNVSAAFNQDLRAAVLDVFGQAGLTTRLRFRSSTNAEDLEVLSGAGLYDSKSGCIADDEDADELGPSRCLSDADAAYYTQSLAAAQSNLAAHPERTWLNGRIADLQQDLSQEKSAALAIKKVWASLWTLRAFEERDYYGIDQRSVYMGIAVNPSFVGEQLDAVVVTNLSLDGATPIYRVVTQVAEVGVVQPEDPTAVAETLTFRRDSDAVSDVQLLVASSYARVSDQSLWTPAQLDTLGALLFEIQDHFEANVYLQHPLSLDLEVKLTRDNHISIKQARPYRLSAP